MTIERRRDANRDSVPAGKICDEFRQVSLQVNSQGQKVGKHEHFGGAGGREVFHGIFQPGIAFEECRFAERPLAIACRIRRHCAYSVIGGSNARSMSEYDNACQHDSYRITSGSSLEASTMPESVVSSSSASFIST